jgi:radical SAM protein with 4Fe4S-binding SPASM domain
MQFIWYTPTCYRQLNPVELGLGVKRCSAASTVLAIEPNGQIIPCQSWFESIGNALENSFSEVWMHPLALRLRNREYLSDKCRECENVSLCAGGCPLENTCRQG